MQPGTAHLPAEHPVLPGTLSPAWSRLPMLQWMDLSHNSIGGHLPGNWGREFMDLQRLDISSNQLTGALPEGESGSHPNCTFRQ